MRKKTRRAAVPLSVNRSLRGKWADPPPLDNRTRHVLLPSRVDQFHPLRDLKQTHAARDVIGFEREQDGEADCFSSTTILRNCKALIKPLQCASYHVFPSRRLNEPANAGVDNSKCVLYTKNYPLGMCNNSIPIDGNPYQGPFNRIIRHRPNIFIRWGFLRLATPDNSLFKIRNF